MATVGDEKPICSLYGADLSSYVVTASPSGTDHSVLALKALEKPGGGDIDVRRPPTPVSLPSG